MIQDQKAFHLPAITIVVTLLAVIGLAGWRVWQAHHLPSAGTNGQVVSYDKQASAQLTGGHCQGAGPVNIGPPMPIDQIGFILPYGLVVGGHVTPVDHQYYNGLDVHALRDSYDVIAPADGTIVGIQHRGSKVNTPAQTVNNPSSDEYRMVMVQTCSFLTYVDLVTSLSDNLKAKLGKNFDPAKGSTAAVDVKKGELLGRIGGQTLDFAVWDLSRPLKGFINPMAYSSENWKVFTAPTIDYLDKSIKDQVIAKYIRTAQPIDGQIDYDVDGKLIGNWFLAGSNGYAGTGSGHGEPGYWASHLSIAPDFIDPSIFNISIGNYGTYRGATATNQDAGSTENSGASQFTTRANAPDPSSVDQSTGLVKYELVGKDYLMPDGQRWDSMHFVKGPKASAAGSVQAVALIQMIGQRQIKFEVFPGKNAAQVSGFDAEAKIYDRGDKAHAVR